jgi:hypothetical protein
VLAAVGQGVGVEVALAVEADAGQDGVVEGVLQPVGVARLGGQGQHPGVPEDGADGGACLGVGGRVRQLVGLAEALAVVAGAETAADVRPGRPRVPPEVLEGLDQRRLARFQGDVGGARHVVHGADGVAGERSHLPQREVVLVVLRAPAAVGAAEPVVAADVDEGFGLLQVGPFARLSVELDQGQLDFRVAIGPGPLGLAGGAELGHHVVGEAAGDPQQGIGAGGAAVGDGGLEEVAGAVELVEVDVGPALAGAIAGEVRVQVAVRPLGGGDRGDGGLDVGRQRGVGAGMGGKGPARRLQPLVEVGVVEEAAVVGAVDLAGRAVEIVQAAGRLDLLPLGRDRDPAVALQAGRPEGVLDPPGVDRDGAEPGEGTAPGVGDDGAAGQGRGGGRGIGHNSAPGQRRVWRRDDRRGPGVGARRGCWCWGRAQSGPGLGLDHPWRWTELERAGVGSAARAQRAPFLQ